MDTLPMEADLLTSRLLNLIDDAGNASCAGAEIVLAAHGNAILVTDCGRGIPKEEIGRITQPFYMVDKSRARKGGGIGLGPALDEEIARLRHAQLTIESEPNRGTAVRLKFADMK